MPLLATDIPDIDVAPAGAAPSRIAASLRDQQSSRRSVLRLLVGTGMALGVSALTVLPGARKAHAAWNSTYSTWQSCTEHSYRWCAAGYVSATLCNGAGYHRDGTVQNACHYQRFTVVFNRCNNTAVTAQKNAWRWLRGQTGGTIASFRCSDGNYYENDCGSVWSTSSACYKTL